MVQGINHCIVAVVKIIYKLIIYSEIKGPEYRKNYPGTSIWTNSKDYFLKKKFKRIKTIYNKNNIYKSGKISENKNSINNTEFQYKVIINKINITYKK